MSRITFPTVVILLVCLLTAACEKENITLNTANAQTATAPEQLFTEVDGATTPSPVDAYAEETPHATAMLEKLEGFSIFAKQGVHVQVTTEAPTDAAIRYFDLIPDPSNDEVPMDVQTADIANFECPYGDCDATISSMTAEYQEAASEQCQDMFLCITCCADGQTTYVVIYIESPCHLPKAQY